MADRLLDIVNSGSVATFSLDNVYAYSEQLASLFPRNRYIHEKIRQTLQNLRDDGLIMFLGEGQYCLNLNHEEIQAELPAEVPVDAPVGVRLSIRSVRLRNTLLAAAIKRRYHHTCQVCRLAVPLSNDLRYAEGHHLRPIGAPHLGPDAASNIIVVCPNHHVMFDRGAVTIVPESLEVRHRVKGVIEANTMLYLQQWHHLAKRNLEYHHLKIFAA